MNGEFCAYCGRPATERDHPSGKGTDGRYLDPSLWLPCCRRCNMLGVDLWRAVGLVEIDGRSPHAVRMGRLGLALARLPAPAPVFGRVDRGGWR